MVKVQLSIRAIFSMRSRLLEAAGSLVSASSRRETGSVCTVRCRKVSHDTLHWGSGRDNKKEGQHDSLLQVGLLGPVQAAHHGTFEEANMHDRTGAQGQFPCGLWPSTAYVSALPNSRQCAPELIWRVNNARKEAEPGSYAAQFAQNHVSPCAVGVAIPLLEHQRLAKCWCTKLTVTLPSPTALATRLTLDARRSPTAKMPGTLVSRG